MYKHEIIMIIRIYLLAIVVSLLVNVFVPCPQWLAALTISLVIALVGGYIAYYHSEDEEENSQEQ